MTNYREYTIQLVTNLVVAEDFLGNSHPQTFSALVDGRAIHNADGYKFFSTEEDAMLAARKRIDRMLTHPITGEPLTKADREAC